MRIVFGTVRQQIDDWHQTSWYSVIAVTITANASFGERARAACTEIILFAQIAAAFKVFDCRIFTTSDLERSLKLISAM